jgi:hypothetical protein
VKSDDASVRAYLFDTRPDGRASQVLVAWATNGEATLTLPAALEKMFDHLGRVQPAMHTLKLTAAPQFAVLANGSARKIALIPPAQQPTVRRGEPSSVVLQALWPEDRIDLNLSAYRVPSEAPVKVPVFIYNFGNKPLHGRLNVAAPSGWTLNSPARLELAPQERKELVLMFENTTPQAKLPVHVRLSGDFGDGGKPVLALRLVHDAAAR